MPFGFLGAAVAAVGYLIVGMVQHYGADADTVTAAATAAQPLLGLFGV